MILHNGTSILITIRFQKFGSSYIEYIPNDEQSNRKRGENIMRLTTLCYIEKDEKYLMLHRTKKKKDENHDKWIGVGGKFEAGESPDECVIREVKEETGLTLTKYQFRGIVTFCSDEWEDEYMHLFTATEFEGNLIECNEGTLEWVDKEKVLSLPTWEGDHLFLERLLSGNPSFFSLKVEYEGDRLAKWKFFT
jgi:8-oxo-dGTP diphosphatase